MIEIVRSYLSTTMSSLESKMNWLGDGILVYAELSYIITLALIFVYNVFCCFTTVI